MNGPEYSDLMVVPKVIFVLWIPMALIIFLATINHYNEKSK